MHWQSAAHSPGYAHVAACNVQLSTPDGARMGDTVGGSKHSASFQVTDSSAIARADAMHVTVTPLRDDNHTGGSETLTLAPHTRAPGP